jgi:hypothetical protein
MEEARQMTRHITVGVENNTIRAFVVDVSVSKTKNHTFVVVQKLRVWFLLDSVAQEVLEQDGRTMIANFGHQCLCGSGPSTIMDCVLGDGVGNNVASMFQIEGTEMKLRAVYTIRFTTEGVWENIDDIVGNRSRL